MSKPQQKQVDDDVVVKPTIERLRHSGGDYEEFIGENNRRTYRMADSPVGRLAIRGKISKEQFFAAEEYHKDAFYSGILSSGVIDTSKERVDGGMFKNMSDYALDALTRFRKSQEKMNPVDIGVLSTVVLSELSLDHYANRIPKNHKSRRDEEALKHLTAALDKLDRHYNPSRQSSGIVSSISERPMIIPRD